MKAILKRVLPRPLADRLRRFRSALRPYYLDASYRRGFAFASDWRSRSLHDVAKANLANTDQSTNPLWNYFINHEAGPGIWKWEHYFDIYHRHFAKFVGTPVRILEIGIYSGGSLDMWKSYFGDQCHIVGVDIEEACRAYASPDVTVLIGDQEDRRFWDSVSAQLHDIDIVIDDGGHTPNQQRVTLEALLPILRPGGVYVCEDIHGIHHKFASFASGLVSELNSLGRDDNSGIKASPFQADCNSIHFYPYLMVIEKQLEKRHRLVATKRGTHWQPFVFDRR